MLGNDIVDLNRAKTESDWKRAGYLAKIFNAEEQALVFASIAPEKMIWLLWSMKEAAYKIINRMSLQRFNSPLKFSCKNLLLADENLGFVKFEDKIFPTKSVMNENFIHTIASAQANTLAKIQTCYLANNDNYLLAFNTQSANYFLEKNGNGIPNLINKTSGISYDASVSHHGKYLAIIFPSNLKI